MIVDWNTGIPFQNLAAFETLVKGGNQKSTGLCANALERLPWLHHINLKEKSWINFLPEVRFLPPNCAVKRVESSLSCAFP